MSGTPIEVRDLGAEDWERVAEIYRAGLATGNATFETAVPSWEEWDRAHLASCRLVAVRDGRVVGWGALSPVSGRCVYGGVAEVSVYIDEAARGAGIGLHLLHALVRASEKAGLWTLEAGIFPENVASVRIHEKAGFRLVGRRVRLGKLRDRWRDVLLLERRSESVGTGA